MRRSRQTSGLPTPTPSMHHRALLFSAALLLAASPAMISAAITSEVWGKTAAGEEVRLFTLKNSTGMEARIT
ncbi:MAG TPA: hypothetical protein DIT13_10360, partial [Verrucomicrobiales bacterium]|nr:hypothetical protein [Verrucomicrobiales bacterium]